MSPVTVVKGKEEAQVFHAVDLQGWVDAGWVIKGSEEQEEHKTAKELLIDEAMGLGIETEGLTSAELKEAIKAKTVV